MHTQYTQNMELQGQTMVYSMVARGNVVVAEYCPLSGGAASLISKQAASFIHNLRPSGRGVRSSAVANVADSSNTFSFTCDSHTFHFLTQDEFIFLVVSKDPNGNQIAQALLQHIQADFYKCYIDGTASVSNIQAHNVYKDYGLKLRDHMQYIMDHSQKLLKLARIKDQVQEAKENAMESFQKVRAAESSATKGDWILTFQEVENFHRQGRKLKRQVWIHRTKVRVVALLICITIILSIWLLICKGFKC